jgi:glycosyltransferase involved in cell wall biosynthesis
MKSQVSVIICAHNPRENYLRRVLVGLQTQTLPFTEWELLLVDNGSKIPVSERVDLSWHPEARHIRENELGLTSARLRGIREAQADIFVFVDDDTVLAADYLEQALTIGTQWPFIGAWGGGVAAEFEIPPPAWIGDQLWRLTVFEVKEDVWSNLRDGFATYPVGAGLCIRRTVARRYLEWCGTNKKSSALDRSGAGLAGYGDMDLCQCAIDIGLGVGRSTKLKLTHLIPAARLTVDYFVRHAEGDAASHLAYRAIRGLPYKHLANYSWFKELVWRLHCWKRRVPQEQRQIHAAHLRGLKKGLALAQEIETAKPKS